MKFSQQILSTVYIYGDLREFGNNIENKIQINIMIIVNISNLFKK